MRRFTGLLLLVTCILPPLLFVNGLQALLPTIKNSPLRTERMIRGLLVSRQLVCQGGFVGCQETGCCPIEWSCCNDGNCCEPTSYCFLGSNGNIGCCPDGRVCSGPVGAPTSIIGAGPQTTISTQPGPISTLTSTPISTSTSTATLTGLLGAPSGAPTYQVIDISVQDPNLNWSKGWVLQTSSCDPSIMSMITTTANSSFTYTVEQEGTALFNYYINAVNYNTDWNVFLNGVNQMTYFADLSVGENCTYLGNFAVLEVDLSQVITVVVAGLTSPLAGTGESWSLEINRLAIQITNSATITISTANLPTQTTVGPVSSAAGRAQPYRPLLVYGSILFAAVILILGF